LRHGFTAAKLRKSDGGRDRNERAQRQGDVAPANATLELRRLLA
jgi:hypothetical protein